MTIHVGFVAFDCKDFQHDGVEKTMAAVVGPIRIVETTNREGEAANLIFNGCSLFKGCQNINCSYSWVSREEGRKAGNDHTTKAAQD